jgi:hypothetical protein
MQNQEKSYCEIKIIRVYSKYMRNIDGMPSGGRRENSGRPPKGSSAFATQYPLRCSHAERAAWERAAKKNGKPLSDWAREALNHAAK